MMRCVILPSPTWKTFARSLARICPISNVLTSQTADDYDPAYDGTEGCRCGPGPDGHELPQARPRTAAGRPVLPHVRADRAPAAGAPVGAGGARRGGRLGLAFRRVCRDGRLAGLCLLARPRRC